MSAQEALDYRLIDEVIEHMPAAKAEIKSVG
jgi:ATP-dependent protease ClpP protease subunit